MATGVVDSYGKNNVNSFGYGSFFRGRKTACRSKPAQGMTVRKAISRNEVSFDERDDGFKQVASMQLEKKRELQSQSQSHNEIAVSSTRIEMPHVSSPESGEFIPSDDSRKRRKIQNRGIRRSKDSIAGCGSVDEYQRLNEISHGAYGVVYRARDKKTGEIVAMKEEFDGLSTQSLREINILKSLRRHPSIVDFRQVVADDKDGVYVVMEYLENDLKRYMDMRKHYLTLNQVKRLMKQLLRGIKFLHDNRVMHRDLKPSNILINSRGNLKICDFGLSRHFGSTSGSYSPNVVTLWYRAPELLLGAKSYSCAIDMWSVGCIMAELLLKQALFRGQSEIEQIEKIYRILGTPNEAVWPGFRSLPGSGLKFAEGPYNLLRQKFSIAAANCPGVPVLTNTGFDLLNRLLTYDPAKRIKAQSALNHAWFHE